MRENKDIIIKIIAITTMMVIIALGNSINLSSNKITIKDKELADANDITLEVKANVLIKDVKEDLKITAKTKIKEEP